MYTQGFWVCSLLLVVFGGVLFYNISNFRGLDAVVTLESCCHRMRPVRSIVEQLIEFPIKHNVMECQFQKSTASVR